MAERKVRVTIEVPEGLLHSDNSFMITGCEGQVFYPRPVSVEPIPQPKSKRQEMIELRQVANDHYSAAEYAEFVAKMNILWNEVITKLWPEE